MGLCFSAEANEISRIDADQQGEMLSPIREVVEESDALEKALAQQINVRLQRSREQRSVSSDAIQPPVIDTPRPGRGETPRIFNITKAAKNEVVKLTTVDEPPTMTTRYPLMARKGYELYQPRRDSAAGSTLSFAEGGKRDEVYKLAGDFMDRMQRHESSNKGSSPESGTTMGFSTITNPPTPLPGAVVDESSEDDKSELSISRISL